MTLTRRQHEAIGRIVAYLVSRGLGTTISPLSALQIFEEPVGKKEVNLLRSVVLALETKGVVVIDRVLVHPSQQTFQFRGARLAPTVETFVKTVGMAETKLAADFARLGASIWLRFVSSKSEVRQAASVPDAPR